MPATVQPKHGNYHGYYNKRPFIADPRLALLPQTFFQQRVVLDIGCNEGWVTCEIAQRWNAKKIVGVEIDESLVNAAWKRRIHVWSLQAPPEEQIQNAQLNRVSEEINGKKRKRRGSPERGGDQLLSIADTCYFPASLAHSFGALAIPVSDAITSGVVFPHNITFKATDWLSQGTVEDSEGYDVILAFSVTKWIHLNGGDDAIINFFKKVFKHLHPGGNFVLEAQSWTGYSKAKRMDDKLKENGKQLELRPENFEEVLVSIGFSPAKHLGMVGEGGFKRAVDLYLKPDI